MWPIDRVLRMPGRAVHPGGGGSRRRFRSFPGGGFWAAALAAHLVLGCPDPQASGKDPLIRAGSQVVTVADFHRARSLVMAGMREVEPEDGRGGREAKVRLLRQLAEEASLMEMARASGVRLGPGELEAAVAALRRDYPEKTFEQTLVENAIRYADWEREMERRLVIEKLLRVKVYDRIRISEAELAEFYRNLGETPGTHGGGPEMETRLIDRLKRRKAEALVGQLMEAASRDFPAQVDEAAVQRLLGP